MDKNKFIAHYFKFAQNYDFEDPMISLKLQHSLSVANFCLEIADFLMLSNDEKQMIFVLGLVHEIGGFEAWQTKKDFINNTQTLKILIEDKHLQQYNLTSEQNKTIQIVLELFYAHNPDLAKLEQKLLKQGYSQERCDEITDYYKILKDADTLDIFEIMKRGSMPPTQKENFTKTSLSRDVLQSFNAGKKLEARQIKSNLDKVLFFVSFYFGLNFSVSKVFAKKINFTNAILNFSSDKLLPEDILRLQKILSAFLKKF